MNNKVLSCLIAAVLGTTLALASPALARGGGGGMGGGGGTGGHGGFGGGAAGGMSGGAHFSGMAGGPHFSGMIGGPRFSGSRFAGAPFAAHAAISPRVSSFAFHNRGRFIHHRFNRFAFVGAPFAYAAYDSCWRRVWSPYGLQWVNVCTDYGY
jgi:hypothetical protein